MKKNNSKKISKNFKKIGALVICGITTLNLSTPIVNAEGTTTSANPLSAINNLSNFIFEIVQAVGVIMVLFGVVQFGLALKSHDPSQRANSLFTIVGGLVVAFAKAILDTIIG